MRRLDPAKLHVKYLEGSSPEGPLSPRAYTLTHSDTTGDLFLTIGPTHDLAQISGVYTRLMRDEVLAEWQTGESGPELHVHCHISGGLVAGSAGMRDGIFRRELPLVLEAFRAGDDALLSSHPELENAPVVLHFHSSSARYDRVETWGTLADYR